MKDTAKILIMSLGFVITAIIVLYGRYQEYRNSIKLKATIDAAYTQPTRGLSTEGERQMYRFEYMVKGKKQYSTNGNDFVFTVHKPGDIVTLIYDPRKNDAPKLYTIIGYWLNGADMAIIALIGIAWAGFMNIVIEYGGKRY